MRPKPVVTGYRVPSRVDDATRSRLRRFLDADGLGGDVWFRWVLVSHGGLVGVTIGLTRNVLDDDYTDFWLGVLIWVACAAGTAAFWHRARRVWRELPETRRLGPPAKPDPRMPAEAGMAGDAGDVRRLT